MVEPVELFAAIVPPAGTDTSVSDPDPVPPPDVDAPSRYDDCVEVTVTVPGNVGTAVALYDTVNDAVLVALLLALQFNRTGLPGVAPTVGTDKRVLLACRKPAQSVSASTATSTPGLWNLEVLRSI